MHYFPDIPSFLILLTSFFVVIMSSFKFLYFQGWWVRIYAHGIIPWIFISSALLCRASMTTCHNSHTLYSNSCIDNVEFIVLHSYKCQLLLCTIAYIITLFHSILLRISLHSGKWRDPVLSMECLQCSVHCCTMSLQLHYYALHEMLCALIVPGSVSSSLWMLLQLFVCEFKFVWRIWWTFSVNGSNSNRTGYSTYWITIHVNSPLCLELHVFAVVFAVLEA